MRARQKKESRESEKLMRRAVEEVFGVTWRSSESQRAESCGNPKPKPKKPEPKSQSQS